MKFQTRKNYEVSLCGSPGRVPGQFRVHCCCGHTTGIQLEVFTDDSSIVTFVSAANITCTGCPRKKFPLKSIYIWTKICTDKRMLLRKIETKYENQQEEAGEGGSFAAAPSASSPPDYYVLPLFFSKLFSRTSCIVY